MKNKIVAALLAWFLGIYGVHWFYLGDNKKAIWYLVLGLVGVLGSWLIVPLLALCVVGVLAFIDCIKFFMMSDEEFNSKYNA